MTVPTFSLNDFLAPLDPWTILMAIILGIVMGFRMRQLGPRMSNARVFWQIADAFVFFIPLSLLRGFEGSLVWERFLTTLPLWIIYIAAMRLGNSFEWDRLPGNRKPRMKRWPETGERRRRDRRMFATVSAPWTGPSRRRTDR